MAVRERRTFPLVPRRRLTGLPFGDLPSRRRGHGSDVIGTRLYEPGDPVSTIDWFATARLSAASGDDFVVRDRAADEAPRVALVVDRRPAMGLYPAPLPWLSKRDAVREAVASIVMSAAAARADIASLDFAGGEAWWLPPGRRERPWLVAERQGDATPFDAPDDSVERSLAFLGRRRAGLPDGSFVFVLSDMLVPVAPETWLDAIGHGWDVVPVVIQDPVWEQSFPAVGGVAVPVADPRDGGHALVRLSRREAARRCDENEQRHARLLGELELALDLRAVAIGTSDPFEIDRAFLEWAEARRRSRWEHRCESGSPSSPSPLPRSRRCSCSGGASRRPCPRPRSRRFRRTRGSTRRRSRSAIASTPRRRPDRSRRRRPRP